MTSRTPATAREARGSAFAGATGGDPSGIRDEPTRPKDTTANGSGSGGSVPGAGITVTRHLAAAERHASLAADVRAGLTANPRELPPKWFYDATGSLLFDRITRLPEYYPTRREHAVLAANAARIATACPATTLIELGSGTSEKTRLLLDALRKAGVLRRFVPFDVDEETLLRAGQEILRSYPGISVHAVVGDFERHLAFLPGSAGGDSESAGAGGVAADRRLVAFLGGTIGNLRPETRGTFLRALRDQFRDGDALLLGTDLVKDPARLVAAYDDSAGVTAAFNRNVLSVINRELDADFDLRGFAHVAAWDPENSWIEMRLRSVREQEANVRALGLVTRFGADEQMRTEISTKFTLEGIRAELAAAGLGTSAQWTDPDGDFALTLAVPA
ncbi:L-histidine N(alpha)-methyltransferase [Parafrankia sp. EUN1f]|uniref:L-histidine N(alpha)-methyltransferase n=1 Tax=Parafrankia sp. EUN1f TaxID=102897 RepID=UPI0001C45F98|nr:L-histidine N(alpha)-methyltransferase [Parafrankia sp. EUN1f]EFC81470.1 methyltransferase [Parafrankia sp. EUN1f]